MATSRLRATCRPAVARMPTGTSTSESSRTAAARPRTRSATRTGLSRMRHTFRAYGFSAGPGRGITCPPSATRRSRSTCWRCWGLAAVGLRFGGPVLAATLAFAWAAYPFTQYAANAHTNDTLMPALLVWAFFVLTSDLHRGALSALAGWAKFAALIVAPLWASYPTLHRPRHALLSSLGFLLVTVACGWIILLDGNPAHALSRLLRADDLDPGPPSLALLDLGLGPVPRCGPAGSARPAETASGAAGRRRPRRLPGPQAEVAAPTRRSHGGAPDRLRDRAHALVAAVHHLVLSIRGARTARRGAAWAPRTIWATPEPRSPNAPRTKLRRLLVPTAGQALSQGEEQHRTAVDFSRCSSASTRPRATIGQPLSEPRHRLKTEKPRICGASLSRGAEI